jgi:hypothetical protein
MMLAGVFVLFHGVSGVEAQKKGHKRVFVLDRLDLPKGAPAELESWVKAQYLKSIEGQDKLLSALPEGTPPIDEKDKGLQGNKPFRKFMKQHNMSAYKVVVQVTEFEQVTKANEAKGGNIISCAVKLRMFGETMPDRVMAFSGDGSATVGIEVGKKIRDKDIQFAVHDALELSIADALATSLKKLNTKPVKKKRKKRRKKK